MHLDTIVQNINQYIDSEGLKRKRLAKRMGMSESNFSDYLNGKRMSGIYDFAAKLADNLGYETTFFMTDACQYMTKTEEEPTLMFSVGKQLSKEGEEGLLQLAKLCDLIEIYDRGDSRA